MPAMSTGTFDENEHASGWCSWIDPFLLTLDLSSNHGSKDPKVLPRLKPTRVLSDENSDIISHYNEVIRPKLYAQDTNKVNDRMKKMSLSSSVHTYRSKDKSSKSEHELVMQQFIHTKLTPRNAQV